MTSIRQALAQELRSPSRNTRVALIVLGFLWGFWAVGTAFDEPQIPTLPELGADLTVGLLMQWVGLYVWGRPGTGRTGPLLFAAGLLWYVGSVWDPPPIGAITFAWRSWYDPVLVAIILGWATAHLRRPVDRLLVGTLAAAYLVRSLTRMFVFDGEQVFNNPSRHNPFVIHFDRAAWEAVENGTIIVSALVALGVILVCFVRWRRASGAARRTLTPILFAGAGMVPLMGWTAFTNQFNGLLALPELPGELVFWSQMILRGAIPIAILVGIYRMQTSRALTLLLVALNRGIPVGGLQEVMRSSLGDPSLRLVFPRPDGVYIDEAGLEVAGPTTDATSSSTAIAGDGGRTIAYLVHDPALDQDVDLMEAARTAARFSLENARLQAEVRSQLEEVRASRTRLVEASDAERRRVERDLHDGAQQHLVTLSLQLKQAQDRASSPDPELAALLGDASGELDLAIAELRELARGIHPSVLSRAGLGQAVDTLAERCQIPVSVTVTTERYSPAINRPPTSLSPKRLRTSFATREQARPTSVPSEAMACWSSR